MSDNFPQPIILGFYQEGIAEARKQGVGWHSLIVLDWFMRWYTSHHDNGNKMLTQRLLNQSIGTEMDFALIRMHKAFSDLHIALGINTTNETERSDGRSDRNDMKIMSRHFGKLVKVGYLERKSLKSSRMDDPEDSGRDQFGSNRSWFAPTKKTLEIRPDWNQKLLNKRKEWWKANEVERKAWRNQSGRI